MRKSTASRWAVRTAHAVVPLRWSTYDGYGIAGVECPVWRGDEADAHEPDRFEWDAGKSEATFAERGLDFEAAALVFDGIYLERPDLRRDYGEPRYLVTGEIDGLVLTVVWTPRGHRRRIISARRASQRERREYRDYRAEIDGTDPGV
jgi:uncharacterized DUF497 family protein